MELKKSPDADLRNKRNGLVQLGLITAMGLCLSAFEYTSFEKPVVSVRGTYIPEEELEEKIMDFEIEKPKPQESQPNDNRNPSGPSSAPVAVIINPVSGPVNPNPINPFIFNEPGDSIVIGGGGDPGPVDIEEFTIVEDMPYYEECKNITNKEERELCTQKMMFGNISKVVKYPSFPKENNIQGTVYVTFRVNTDGEIDDVTVKRSVQKDLDQEALRVVSKLPKMVPGQQRGKKVNVRYTVPIKFYLRN